MCLCGFTIDDGVCPGQHEESARSGSQGLAQTFTVHT